MSWVIYLGSGTNWCSPVHAQDVTGQYGTYGGTGGYGELPIGVTTMRGIGSISILDRNYSTVLSATLPPD
jgi:hypothetical protein